MGQVENNVKKSLGAKIYGIPSPIRLVGTYGENGKPNIMTAAWVSMCCLVPPCITVSLQKSRATYANIIRNKAFTVNIPSESHLIQVDFVGITSGTNTDKFSVSGLTPIRSKIVEAPYIQEFPLIFECKLLHVIDIGSHTQFIGEVVDTKADEAVLGVDGMPSLAMIKPLVYNGPEQAYYGVGSRLGPAHSMGSLLQVASS